MDLFFQSELIIFLGGIAALLLFQRYSLMKIISVAFICVGCLMGLYNSISILNGETVFASFKYLNTFSLSFKADGLSAFFLSVIFLVSFLSTLYSYHYMSNLEKSLKISVNYLFYSILIASMALVVTADNMISFMFSWEIMSLSSFFLVMYNYKEKENRKAGYLYFVFSHIGAMFIFGAFGLIYAHTGNFAFVLNREIPESIKIIIFVLSFIGFGSKAGVFPFHIWLPHAHPAAPSHISAVMSGVMIKTGIYGILRIYTILDMHSSIFGIIVLVFGIISGILGVVYALGQHDLKRLLAYHSVENIGIILIGIGLGMIGVAYNNPAMAVLGFAGGLLHVLNHAIFKSLLFMGAGMVLHKTGTRSIDILGGLIKKMKVTGITFLIGSLAISGLPPFNGFVSEFFVYFGGFKGISMNSTPFVLSLLAIISLAIIGGLALACFTKVVGVVFQGEPRSKQAENVNEKGITMLISMVISAALCMIIGVFPEIFIRMTIKAVSAMELGYSQIPLDSFIEMTGNITRYTLLFLIVFIIIFIIRTILYTGKTVRQSGTWGCGFTQPTVKMQYTGSSYAASILEFFKPFAPLKEDHPPIKGRLPKETHYHSHIDDIAELHLDKIINPVTFFLDKLRWIQHGDIHLYIAYILLTIILLMFFI
ncbi:hydrogenase [bacterium]|nr:hydrogenase [bacterium]